jgi:hypothetical protein
MTLRLCRNLLAALLGLLISSHVDAAPGAHGPNGEHLDAPAARTAAGQLPMVERATELYELVAELHPDRLLIFIDRYASNEPVVSGTLAIDIDGDKSAAQFDASSGGFTLTDPQRLAKLTRPGSHTLLFTLVEGDNFDLIDAVLNVPGHAPQGGAAHDHHHDHQWWWLIGVGMAVAVSGLLWWRRGGAA